jgi:hypothetical protein
MMHIIQKQDRRTEPARAIGDPLRQRRLRPVHSPVEPVSDLGILTDLGLRERCNNACKENPRHSRRGIQREPNYARAV